MIWEVVKEVAGSLVGGLFNGQTNQEDIEIARLEGRLEAMEAYQQQQYNTTRNSENSGISTNGVLLLAGGAVLLVLTLVLSRGE